MTFTGTLVALPAEGVRNESHIWPRAEQVYAEK